MAEDLILDTIDDFKKPVDTIGAEVLEEFSDEHDGRAVRGLRCGYGNNLFLIYAVEGNSSITVEYQYRVLNDYIVAGIDSDEEGSHVVTIDRDEESDVIENAESQMHDFLMDIEEDTVQRFYVDILQKLRNDSVGYEVYDLDNDGRVTGFELTTSLFPHHQEISPKELFDAVQAILSMGIPTRAYIQYSYGLRQYDGGQPVISNVGGFS